jgi:putative SOS response-associated peptidase YedK
MCGRYDNLIARDAYRALFRAGRLPSSNFPPRYNVAPTDQIPIVRIDPRDGEREVTMARWGLIPFCMKPNTATLVQRPSTSFTSDKQKRRSGVNLTRNLLLSGHKSHEEERG